MCWVSKINIFWPCRAKTYQPPAFAAWSKGALAATVRERWYQLSQDYHPGDTGLSSSYSCWSWEILPGPAALCNGYTSFSGTYQLIAGQPFSLHLHTFYCCTYLNMAVASYFSISLDLCPILSQICLANSTKAAPAFRCFLNNSNEMMTSICCRWSLSHSSQGLYFLKDSH